MGVSHRPGFGLLGSVPRSLSTQPPFATQALILSYSMLNLSTTVFLIDFEVDNGSCEEVGPEKRQCQQHFAETGT